MAVGFSLVVGLEIDQFGIWHMASEIDLNCKWVRAMDSEQVCVCPPLDKGFRPTDPPITFSTRDSHAGGWRGHVRLHPTKLLTCS